MGFELGGFVFFHSHDSGILWAFRVGELLCKANGDVDVNILLVPDATLVLDLLSLWLRCSKIGQRWAAAICLTFKIQAVCCNAEERQYVVCFIYQNERDNHPYSLFQFGKFSYGLLHANFWKKSQILLSYPIKNIQESKKRNLQQLMLTMRNVHVPLREVHFVLYKISISQSLFKPPKKARGDVLKLRFLTYE